MSVLIKGTEMPDSCAECPLRNQELFKGSKYVYGCTLCGGWGTDQTRAYDCPLVEIPAPHGNLIDGNDLFSDFMRAYSVGSQELCLAEELIECAEIIIEAEE